MVYVIIEHRVKDYNMWRPIFNEHSAVRKKFGEKSSRVYQDSKEPNHVYVMFEWESEQKSRDFLEKSDLKEIMAKAGVVGKPDVHMLNAAF